MINKRLVNFVPRSKKYIGLNVVFQWISLICNIVIMSAFASTFQNIYDGTGVSEDITKLLLILSAMLAIRFLCTVLSNKMAYLSRSKVKKTLRERIYSKLLDLGASYNSQLKTSEIVQVAVEGVDQLETYFGQYLPQFFYAMIAPVTLFAILSGIDFKAALVLLICVPLIPVTIVAVQKFAKKLLSKYWGQYTELGDTFLENLQGLTTTKIYRSDEFKHKEMNRQSENFRKITMKVLTMQLNSITVMDLIAYGGAALGIILAVSRLKSGNTDMYGCIMIILLRADFFLPMRLLGSFFHIAMNGMAASEKIFKLLDLSTEKVVSDVKPAGFDISCRNLYFGYDEKHHVLQDINADFPNKSFNALVGESGCGKSTLASIIVGKNKNYAGNISVGGVELRNLSEDELLKEITYIGFQSYIFKGTVRENLLMGKKNATEDEMWSALKNVNLDGFIKSENGLDTKLNEMGSNFSGGQRQRLALARALLHDSSVYIFDEATSNIDADSENIIMRRIYKLAGEKTVILISHRLANVVNADKIYVLAGGSIAEQGTHDDLLAKKGVYANLWNSQLELENYIKGGDSI